MVTCVCTAGGTRTRTTVADHRIFLPTMTFVTQLRFVVWTFSLPYCLGSLGIACQVSTPSSLLRLGSGLPDSEKLEDSPNLSDSTLKVSFEALKFLMFLVDNVIQFTTKKFKELSPACLPFHHHGS